jgi:hypothetical protein
VEETENGGCSNWIKEEVEATLQSPFCGCRPAWRLEPAGAVLHRYGPYSIVMADELEALKARGLVEEGPAAAYAPCFGAAVKVYKLRLTERGRETARQTVANLPEELTREIERLLRHSLCDLCGPMMKMYKDLDRSPDDELAPRTPPNTSGNDSRVLHRYVATTYL